jgi:alkyl hydroperoxide reductase subunit AhpC
MLIYPMSTGRNFAEVLRILDSLQLTAKMGVSTPVNWQPGGDVVVPAAMSEEEVKKKFPNGLKTLKPYLRLGSLPKS